MATLEQLLLLMSHADLRAVATRLGLRRRNQHSKEQWAAAVASAWSDAEQRNRMIETLTPDAKAALLRLAEAGELPASLFWGAFGPVQRAVTARGEQRKPWQKPQNAAEELYYSGLLHPLGARSLRGAPRVQLPADLRMHLRQESQESQLGAPGEVATALVHDLGQLLIYCNAHPHLSLHSGRWLRPQDLPGLNLRLRWAQPASRLRSHRRNPWLTFLSMLAACAQLHDCGRLTAHGWAWLHLSPAAQLQVLWQAWSNASPELRLRFSVASAGLAEAGLRELLRCLPVLEPAFTARQLTDRFAGSAGDLNSYFTVNFPSLADLEAVVRHLLAGELLYFGIVRAAAGPRHTLRLFALTPIGELLLAGALAPLGTESAASTLSLLSAPGEEELYIHLAGLNAMAAQAVVALYARHVAYASAGAGQPADIHTYRLDRSSLRQAVANGYGLPSFFAALHEAGLHCTVEQQRLLITWAAGGGAIRLCTQALLETDTVELLAELLRRPSVARLLGRVLRPTIAAVDGSSAELVGELFAAGYLVQGRTSRRRGQQPGKAMGAFSGESTALWLAGMVYAELGRFLPLPLPPPYTALAQLQAGMSLHDRAAVEGQFVEVTANLLRWLDHFSYTPPPEATEPERWIPLLQEAIGAGRTVDMRYFSAGRNLVARYIVEPYWLEEHQGVPCLRGDPRTGSREAILFRLDRIQALTWFEPGDDPPPDSTLDSVGGAAN